MAAIVDAELHGMTVEGALRKLHEVPHAGCPKTVDALVVVSQHAQVAVAAGQSQQQGAPSTALVSWYSSQSRSKYLRPWRTTRQLPPAPALPLQHIPVWAEDIIVAPQQKSPLVALVQHREVSGRPVRLAWEHRIWRHRPWMMPMRTRERSPAQPAALARPMKRSRSSRAAARE